MEKLKSFISQFLVKNKPIIGLDIGKAEIKMVLLEGRSLEGAIIKEYAIQSILTDKKKDKQANTNPTNQSQLSPEMEEMERVASAIRKCWKKLNTQVKDVAICLPSAAVVTKKTILPKFENQDEMEEKVKSEIESTTPFNLSEVNIDFQILGDNESSPTESDVLIWAARKEKVEEIVAIVETAGLNPAVLDIEHYCIFNALNFIEDKIHPVSEQSATGTSVDIDIESKTASALVKKNLSLVLDLGYAYTKLIVYKNTDVTYSRESEVNISQLNTLIQERFGQESIGEVEKSKKSQSLPVEYGLEVLPQFLNNYCQEIARLIEFFFSATASSPEAVRGIYLTGGGAAIEGMVSYLQKSIYDQVLQDKIKIIAMPQFFQKNDKFSLSLLQKDETSLTVACGLAMRRFLKTKIVKK